VDLQGLRAQFASLYPDAGAPFLCRIPGRVNLMGEHLDYNGLPVLPMAIDRAIYIAFAPSARPSIRLANADGTFAAATFENGAEIAPSPGGAWENYAKAAVAGLNQHFGGDNYPGMEVLVASDLPRSAGLSSSSALVVGVGMAYLAALGYTLDEDISRPELAALLAGAERYVGTEGGGMDHAAILLGEAGCATRINFIPFQVEQVPLPEGVSVIVCDSLVAARKSGEVLRRYNAGPACCGLMTALIDRHLKENFGEEFAIDCFGELWFGPLCFNRAEVQALLDEVFPTPFLAPQAVAARLGCSESELREYWLDAIPTGPEGLPLQARARHVFTEYYRVEEGRDALLAGDGKAFGKCMNASHASCADDYEISTPELDALCAILNEAGCYGARLTGAGFGGAVVALAPEDQTSAILTVVGRRYYEDKIGYDGPPTAFATVCAGGALHIS